MKISGAERFIFSTVNEKKTPEINVRNFLFGKFLDDVFSGIAVAESFSSALKAFRFAFFKVKVSPKGMQKSSTYTKILLPSTVRRISWRTRRTRRFLRDASSCALRDTFGQRKRRPSYGPSAWRQPFSAFFLCFALVGGVAVKPWKIPENIKQISHLTSKWQAV